MDADGGGSTVVVRESHEGTIQQHIEVVKKEEDRGGWCNLLYPPPTQPWHACCSCKKKGCPNIC